MSIDAITGGNGFIGKHLRAALVDEGRKVRVLSRSPAPDNMESDKLIEYHQADLAMASPAVLDAFLKGVKTLYHLAGMVSRDPQDRNKLHEVFVEGTRKLLNVARVNGVKRVVLLSTSGTVGISVSPDGVADDDSPYAVDIASRWGYYAAKIAQEKAALEWARETGVELIALRPSLVLGPGDDYMSSTGDVVKFLRKQLPSQPAGGLSLVDVRDVIAACLAARDVKIPDGPTRTYLLGSANWTVREFFEHLEKLSGVSAPFLQIPRGPAMLAAGVWSNALNPLRTLLDLDEESVDMAYHYWYINSTRAVRELGIQFRDPMQTLADTIQYIRAKGIGGVRSDGGG